MHYFLKRGFFGFCGAGGAVCFVFCFCFKRTRMVELKIGGSERWRVNLLRPP